MSHRYPGVRLLPATRSTSATASSPPNARTRASSTALIEHEKWLPRAVSRACIIGYLSVARVPIDAAAIPVWTNGVLPPFPLRFQPVRSGVDSVRSLDLRPSGAADDERELPGDRHRGAARERRHAHRVHRLAGDDTGARRPVRRRDGRPSVHPRRRRTGQADAVRGHDRPRFPDAVAGGAGQSAVDERHRRRDGRQLRPRPSPLPGAAPGRRALARRHGDRRGDRRIPAVCRSRRGSRSRSRTRRSPPASRTLSYACTAAPKREHRRREARRDRRSRSRRAQPLRAAGSGHDRDPRRGRPLLRGQPAAAERAGGRRLLPRAEHARGHLHRR